MYNSYDNTVESQNYEAYIKIHDNILDALYKSRDAATERDLGAKLYNAENAINGILTLQKSIKKIDSEEIKPLGKLYNVLCRDIDQYMLNSNAIKKIDSVIEKIEELKSMW